MSRVSTTDYKRELNALLNTWVPANALGRDIIIISLLTFLQEGLIKATRKATIDGGVVNYNASEFTRELLRRNNHVQYSIDISSNGNAVQVRVDTISENLNNLIEKHTDQISNRGMFVSLIRPCKSPYGKIFDAAEQIKHEKNPNRNSSASISFNEHQQRPMIMGAISSPNRPTI